MTATAIRESLRVSDLCLSIGGSAILRGVNLSIRPNTVFCLMGRNGVGKSTTLKALMGLLPVESGAIEFGDTRIETMPTAERARLGIGYVPQGREIFPHLSVQENLFIGTRARGIKPTADDIDRVFTLFPVIKEFLKRKGGMLSGGQQQQLAIGRALLTNPSLLILDEPTEGIQPNIIDQIGEAVKLLRRGGHHNEAGLLTGINLSLKNLRKEGIEESPLVAEVGEIVKVLLREGVEKHPAMFNRFADCIEQLRREQPSGTRLGDEIGNALMQLRGEARMSILLVEQYLDFCRELGDDFAILERGAVAATGEMSSLSDETIKTFLTV
jgi:urea transport system ATP-binding protein